MKRFYFFLLFAAFSAMFFSAFKLEKTGNLTIHVHDIQQLKGNISILIFKNDDGWPNEYKKAVFAKGVPVNSERIVQEVKNLPYGTYAIAILHDINDNKVADKSIFGIPQEPFGFSNYPKITFGVPDFKDVAFELDAPNKEIVIKMMEI